MGEPGSDKKLPAGGADEAKVRNKSKKDKVKVEKAAAEGLPPGWIKEVKMTKKFGKVRRDAFYVDPASGYVFRSMKDALRYVETGVLGKLAFKPKDTDETDEDMHDGESPTEAKKQKVAVHGAKGSEEEGEKDPGDVVSASPTSGGALLNEKSAENEKTRSTKKNRPTQVKKTPDLPRRASKRIAGIALDPLPGLKSNTRANQTAAKQPDNVVAVAAEESSPEGSADKAKEGKSSSSATRNDVSGKVETESKAESKAESTDDLVNQKPALDSTLADLWSDPCIAFAIKTLTGIADDTPKVSSESNSSKYPMTTTSEEHTGNIIPPELAGKLENSNDIPCADIFSDPCIEFAIKTLTGVIPIDCDQQISSSLQAQSSGHSNFSDVGSGNYPRTSLFSQQFNVSEPAFSFARTTSLQSSGGTALHHRGNGRR